MKNAWILGLWEDRNLLELPLNAEDAPRSLVIGKLGGHYRAALITYQQGRRQVLGARSAHKWEIDAYESC